MPKPVSRFEVELPSRALSKKRKVWICPECFSVHLDFRRDMCRNEKCVVYKIEGLPSMGEEEYAEVRKKEIARCTKVKKTPERRAKVKTGGKKLRDVRGLRRHR